MGKQKEKDPDDWTKWADELIKELDKKENAEDFCYLYRAEADAPQKRLILRLYPVWAAIMQKEEDILCRMLEKGYAAHSDEEKTHLFFDYGVYGGKEAVIASVRMYAVLTAELTYMYLTAKEESLPAMTELLKKYSSASKEDREYPATTMRKHILADLPEDYPPGKLEERLEKLKDAVPQVYGLIFEGTPFWNELFDVSKVEACMRNEGLITRWTIWNEGNLAYVQGMFHAVFEKWPLDGIPLKTVLQEAFEEKCPERDKKVVQCLIQYYKFFRWYSRQIDESVKSEVVRCEYIKKLQEKIRYVEEVLIDCDYYYEKRWGEIWRRIFQKELNKIRKGGEMKHENGTGV